MYFDRIERSEVTTLIDSIYANVESLEDMQFFVQYAAQVLPSTVAEASGEKIWQNILDLQDDLIQKREASIMTLANALTQLYPEQKPESVRIRFHSHISRPLLIPTHGFIYSYKRQQEKLHDSFKKRDLPQKKNYCE